MALRFGINGGKAILIWCRTYQVQSYPVKNYVPAQRKVIKMALKLGEMLIKHNIITEQQLEKTLQEQSQLGVGRLGYHLVRMGFVEEGTLSKFLGRQFKLPFIDLSKGNIPQTITKLIPKDIVVKYQVVPVKQIDRKLTVVIGNPHDMGALADLKHVTGMDEIEPIVAAESAIKKAIDKYYENADSLADLMGLVGADNDMEVVEEKDDFEAVTSMLEKLITAIESGEQAVIDTMVRRGKTLLKDLKNG